MADLVEKVARAIWDESAWGETEPEGFENAARAAIAVVLDELEGHTGCSDYVIEWIEEARTALASPQKPAQSG